MPNIRVTEPVGATKIAAAGQISWSGFLGAAKRWTRITKLPHATIHQMVQQRETARNCAKLRTRPRGNEFRRIRLRKLP